MKKAALLIGLILVISCKKESQESFGQPTEVSQTPEQIGKAILKEKAIAWRAINPIKKLLDPVFTRLPQFIKRKTATSFRF